MNENIKIEREPFVFKGKTCYRYFLCGNVRGTDVKIQLAPYSTDKTDRGGYAVLDIVFGEAHEADFIVSPFEFTDETTGKTITGNRFIARTVDENGEIYECRVKPARESDKSLLNMLLR